MNTHTGFCIVCGYTTQVDRHHGRRCPFGHGDLGIIQNKVVKLFLKRGMSGRERIESLKSTLPNIYERLMENKEFEVSMDFYLREAPHQITKPYGQISG